MKKETTTKDDLYPVDDDELIQLAQVAAAQPERFDVSGIGLSVGALVARLTDLRD